MAKLEDLTIGTRVWDKNREAAGTVEQTHTMNNSVTPPRPVVHLVFAGKRVSYGLAYAENLEIITEEA